MAKAFGSTVAFVLAACVAVASVVCCCIAPASAAHAKKRAVCSHCPAQKGTKHSANPAGTCQYHLTDAEAFSAQAVVAPALVLAFARPVFFHRPAPGALSPAPAFARGSPPLGRSLPLYLQIHSLRI